MAGDGVFKWWAGEGKDPEVYRIGADDWSGIIEAAHKAFPQGNFTIVEADKAVLHYEIFSDFAGNGDLSEMIDDVNGGAFGEDGPDFFCTDDENAELDGLLNAVIADWIERHGLHPRAVAFGETRNQDYFPPSLKDDEDGLSCEGCRKAVRPGDLYCWGEENSLCESCAPTYRSMIDEPESWTDGQGNPQDPQALRASFEAHLAAGGKPEDKVVQRMEAFTPPQVEGDAA
ncbi:hypothetical protein BJF92_11165 [Rhizobium rhizosphaerae]|uniref:Uncharacterized protein n=1 Tax=Xaviernesmea rhizosphaerae TaxID=1672749 RepID=A0A1Q9AMQ5_9HYPH|nr:hypothetical protein [Xaviernesmea rhizosphaerae]OLP56643.1 hypothetical protein BJF92_11165 [Xaviernesmea rhizosphaerae]